MNSAHAMAVSLAVFVFALTGCTKSKSPTGIVSQETRTPERQNVTPSATGAAAVVPKPNLESAKSQPEVLAQQPAEVDMQDALEIPALLFGKIGHIRLGMTPEQVAAVIKMAPSHCSTGPDGQIQSCEYDRDVGGTVLINILPQFKENRLELIEIIQTAPKFGSATDIDILQAKEKNTDPFKWMDSPPDEEKIEQGPRRAKATWHTKSGTAIIVVTVTPASETAGDFPTMMVSFIFHDRALDKQDSIY